MSTNFKGTIAKLWLISIVLFCCQPAIAYSIKNHQFITQQAVRIVNQCSLGMTVSAEQELTLIEFNLVQDKPLNKLILWHFPDPQNQSYDQKPKENESWLYGLAVEHTTFNRWVEYLDSQAISKPNSSDRFAAIGAILHFIQDLAVPSHAVPIFHPSKGVYPDELDKWDKFNLKGEQLDLEIPQICSELDLDLNDDTASMLAKVRENTLLSLQGKYSEDCHIRKNCNWNIFWPKQIFEYGFGQYGCAGIDRFGKIDSFECEGDILDIDESTYKHFASERILAATIASAKLILFMINSPTKPTIFPNCQDNIWLPNRSILKCIVKD